MCLQIYGTHSTILLLTAIFNVKSGVYYLSIKHNKHMVWCLFVTCRFWSFGCVSEVRLLWPPRRRLRVQDLKTRLTWTFRVSFYFKISMPNPPLRYIIDDYWLRLCLLKINSEFKQKSLSANTNIYKYFTIRNSKMTT